SAPKSGLDTIVEEHKHLRATLARLEKTTDLGAMVTCLEDLHSLLESHFADEEGPDGLASTIGQTTPQNLRRLDHLFEEHKLFLKETAELQNWARYVLDELHTAIIDDTKKLVEEIRRHESVETELLTDSAYTEIGGGD
ncbi:MAG: hypothetical protein OEZ54_05390, partial [Gemmatimonadota bacterium]|nr:hypothetical protein [Gemmatimonadota bacterium]